ncbi:MAG TPA: MarR family transcriptional regulator [Streptosporangiaceae bacterium]|nr:MarR family transcriptional regulator [Streptosporangiaceae bacterium]
MATSTGPATSVPAVPGQAAGGPALREAAGRQPAAPDIDVARLRVAVLRLSRNLRKHDLADLTPTQLSALATISRDGPMRLGDLAAAERVAPSTLTRLVSALEERGYVERGVVPGDARACMVSLTGSGTVVLNRIRQETTSLLTETLRVLPPDQLAALAAALPALEQLSEFGS